MIHIAEPDLTGNELTYVIDCINSGWISSRGQYIKRFEDRFAKYCKAKYATSVSNGTVALHLALAAAGIKEGDEVIIPNLTFIATANAVRYCNATPVFVDVDNDDLCIDTKEIKKKITKKTKAIIPVHLYGKPCDMDEINKIARKHNLVVIEDCAEALGAEYKGKKVGCLGDIGCFSFYANKIITTGEGGMCTTNNKKLYEKMVLLKNHGMSEKKRYWHPEVGFNYRLTNTQAAIGLAQMERIDSFIKKRRKIMETYNSLLKNHENIFILKEKKYAKDVCWMYSVLIDKRDDIIDTLKSNDIESRPFFYPITAMPPYFSKEQFVVSEFASRNGINLPSSTLLEESQIKKICEILKNAYRNI